MKYDNYLVNIKQIFEIRKRIEENLNKINNNEILKTFSSLLNILLLPYFSDYREVNKIGTYKVLVFGINSIELIKKIIGINASGIVKKEMSYLVNIKRDYRNKIVIDFKKSLQFSEEKKIQIMKLFEEFDNSVDIKRFLKTENSNLPSLTINDFKTNNIYSFLNNPGTDIIHLLGLNLVERVNIYIQQDSTDSFFSLINSLEIITPKAYQHLTDNSNKTNDIQNYVKNNIIDYNLAILDTHDDPLIIEYLDLIKKYTNRYEFQNPNLNTSILNNMFCTTRDTYLKDTRLYDEKPKYKDLILPNNLDYLSKVRNSKTNLIFILNYILSVTLAQTKTMDTNSEQKIMDLNNLIVSKKKEISADIKELPYSFLAIKNIRSKFEKLNYFSLYKNNRETIFSYFNEVIEELIQFCEKYCSNKKNKLEIFKNDILSENEKYCAQKRHVIFWKRYKVNQINFESFIEKSIITELESIIVEIKSSLDIQSCSRILNECESFFNKQIDSHKIDKLNYSLSNLAKSISNEISNLYN